mgnify:CR=1 FL=1
MLQEVIAGYQTELEALANSWLSAGATAFGVLQYGKVLQSWPSAAHLPQQSCKVPITIRELTIGELFVAGAAGPAGQQRLEADACLLARVVLAVAEMESIAEELINSQDQLLTLYNMMESTFQLADVSSLIEGVATIIQQLFSIEGAFIWLSEANGQKHFHQAGQNVEPSILERLIQHVCETNMRLVLNTMHRAPISLPSTIDNVMLMPLLLSLQTQ